MIYHNDRTLFLGVNFLAFGERAGVEVFGSEWGLVDKDIEVRPEISFDVKENFIWVETCR